MNIAHEIEARANKMFAELRGLRLYDGHKGHISSLQQKDMGDGMELKVRRVRTPAGVRRFGLPIGSIIGSRGKLLKNIKIEDPVFDDWDLVKDNKGKKYDVGKDDDGKWRAYGHNDWDDMVVEADSEEAVFEALNDKLGGKEAEAPKRSTTSARQNEEVQKQGATRRLSVPTERITGPGGNSKLGRVRKGEQVTERQIRANTTDGRVVESSSAFAVKMGGKKFLVEPDDSGNYVVTRAGKKLGSYKKSDLKGVLEDIRNDKIAAPSSPEEPKDPSYRRGADRLRRAGIKDFRPNQARQVDEMTRDQWEEAQLEVDAGASISEVLAKRAVAQREAQEERLRAYNGGREIPTDKEVEEWEHERRGHELVSQLGPKQKREYDALKPRYQEMYRSNRAGGDSHKQAMDKNPANARRVPSPNTPGKQVAERTQGAGKPKAERTDAEIEASLNNAFKKQFDTLSGSQKRKYFAAFRQGKTHSEAMAAARGGSGKAQGTLF